MSSAESPQSITEPLHDLRAGSKGKAVEPHPAGRVRHGNIIQVVRMLLATTFFNCCVASIHTTQILGSPLYFINKDYFYSYMALTKQSFGLVIIILTEWFSPTIVRVCGDETVRGQLRKTQNGRLETGFPERIVLMGNHQLYTDWFYMWWIAYTSDMHGHICIILKESLKYVPFIGPGSMFFGFIFMARNWAKDKSRLQHRLQKLKAQHSGPLSGTQSLDPMWLLIYPEGTNLSANTRKGSAKWAEKQNIADFRHLLLPRSTGLHFCLQELAGTVDWVYDCTTAYEGIPRGGYGQDYFTLRSTFLQGRPPKSVNMHWRRFAVSSIPIGDTKAFEKWIMDRWSEKEALLEYYSQNGRFPADEESDSDIQAASADDTDTKPARGAGFIETEVKLASWYEIGKIFVVLASFALVIHNILSTWRLLTHDVFLRQGLGW